MKGCGGRAARSRLRPRHVQVKPFSSCLHAVIDQGPASETASSQGTPCDAIQLWPTVIYSLPEGKGKHPSWIIRADHISPSTPLYSLPAHVIEVFRAKTHPMLFLPLHNQPAPRYHPSHCLSALLNLTTWPLRWRAQTAVIICRNFYLTMSA